MGMAALIALLGWVHYTTAGLVYASGNENISPPPGKALRILAERGIVAVLPFLNPATERGGHVEILISFLIAVMAGVACHYIIKWLDGDD